MRSRRQLVEVGRLAAFLGLLTLLMFGLRMLHLVWNFTTSMPVGLYQMLPIDHPIARGDMVLVCAPPDVAKLARERGMLMSGPCAHQSAPLVKIVAAVEGDVVDLRDDGVRVNGTLLPGSARLRTDRENRPVPRISAGRYALGSARIWLWTPYPRSWDSRYFGPVAVRNVRGFGRALWVTGEGKEWDDEVRVLSTVKNVR